jgi:protein CpxP
MKKRTVIILLSSVLLMALTVTGCYRKTPEQRADRIVNDIVKKLDLNETQKAKLETIKQEFLAKGQEIKKTREETYDQMIGFMRSPSIDQAALSGLVEKDKAQLDDLNSFLFAKFTEFHGMLTPEQREKAAKEMEYWREKYREHEH